MSQNKFCHNLHVLGVKSTKETNWWSKTKPSWLHILNYAMHAICQTLNIVLIHCVVNSRPKEDWRSTNCVPIGLRQLWWWWHCQRTVLGQLYGVGSAPYIAVGGHVKVWPVWNKSYTAAEQCEAPHRVTALQYLLSAARADMRYLTQLQIPTSSTPHYWPKPIKVSKPWVIHSLSYKSWILQFWNFSDQYIQHMATLF